MARSRQAGRAGANADYAGQLLFHNSLCLLKSTAGLTALSQLDSVNEIKDFLLAEHLGYARVPASPAHAKPCGRP
jgi:hypothetical protein